MRDVVVDTDVFSFVFKGDTRAGLYAKNLNGRQINLSFTTVAELYRWSLTHGWGKRRVQSLEVSLARCSILPYDDETSWEWARVMSIKGQPMSPGDAWIAAAAIRHGFPLVTHNRKHFDCIPRLTVISEA
jgi:tRNA(fMet)-specific endonuclease VapC